MSQVTVVGAAAGLRGLHIKSFYRSGEDRIVADFFEPCLGVSRVYDRLAGFFSSSCFAVASRGILPFVQNGGHMRIVCSPRLQEADAVIISKTPDELERVVTERLGQDIDHASACVAERDHLAILAYMLAKGQLEMRLAVPAADGEPPQAADASQTTELFHEKVGIMLDDAGNAVSFSGSINESALAWVGNIEEFKVFRSWESAQCEYQHSDTAHFNAVWEGSAPGVWTFDLPTAIAKRLIQLAPPELDFKTLRHKYDSATIDPPIAERQGVHLFQYQEDAIDQWFAADRKGIFAMATGTGKTYTAIGCVKRLTREESRGFLCVISVPQLHLVDQWTSAINKFPLGIRPIVADGTQSDWRARVSTSINDLILGTKSPVVIVGSHATVSSKDFISLVMRCTGKVPSLLIGDEVHRLGAPAYSAALRSGYLWRLGLSATPDRYMDELGSQMIRTFFGDTVFEFSLGDAIRKINPATHRTYLVPYNLYPLVARLTSSEMRQYLALTRQIQSMNHDDSDPATQKHLEQLYFKRARVLRDAEQKEEVFVRWLQESKGSLHHAIVYCSDKQMGYVRRHLDETRIMYHTFTMTESVRPEERFGGRTERQAILDAFADGTYRVLVAMKCLDEGVDIPQAETALLLANSSSNIEHIQRLGRLLRPCEGKTSASVYDAVTLPPASSDADATSYAAGLLEVEASRERQLASWADNQVEAIATVQREIIDWRQ